ncbi:MAG: GtrA family protein [Pseudomonadota bacterium]|nr:GtrA family protein [Pseudomonadota bacterium]
MLELSDHPIDSKHGRGQEADVTAPQASRAQFLRFAVIGAVGFALDGGGLMILTEGFDADPIAARFATFSCAVVTTWLLNRRFAFVGGGRSLIAEFGAYLGVQGFGFLCNLAVYSIAVLLLPYPLDIPIVALVMAAGVGLLANFLGLKHLVFIRPEKSGRREG